MAISVDDLQSNPHFGGGKERRAEITWLPEPEPAEVTYTVISVDDHIVEPPDTFTGRFPAKLRDEEPRVVPTEDGGETWLWCGERLPNVGFNAVVGRPSSEYGFEPARFDEMRRGAWDIDARIADMDLNGVHASLCFPSFLPGFVGQRLTMVPDEQLARAAFEAYNDWHLEVWHGRHPDRIIPSQIAWLRDPVQAAKDVRRNAERGFRAVTFSENPTGLGLPSIHTGYWDPFLEACAETETVVCLHVGSSGSTPATTPDAPPETIAVLFFGYAMNAAVDWLYSKVAVRFPELKVVLSEGGIGWVAGLIDRLDHCFKYQLGYLPTWRGVDLTPAEVLRRNFWFCAIDDRSGFATRDVIGVENILLESDYPHADSTWPHTQDVLREHLAGIPETEVRRMTWQNASELFRFPVPEALRR